MGQNPEKSEIEQMIKDVDKDGSGKIEFNEFVMLMHRRATQEPDQSEEFKQAFQPFDAAGSGSSSDHTGKASLTEMSTLLRLMDEQNQGSNESEDVIRVLEENSVNGVIDYNQLISKIMAE